MKRNAVRNVENNEAAVSFFQTTSNFKLSNRLLVTDISSKGSHCRSEIFPGSI